MELGGPCSGVGHAIRALKVDPILRAELRADVLLRIFCQEIKRVQFRNHSLTWFERKMRHETEKTAHVFVFIPDIHT